MIKSNFIISNTEPSTNSVWYDPTTEEIRVYNNGWKPISIRNKDKEDENALNKEIEENKIAINTNKKAIDNIITFLSQGVLPVLNTSVVLTSSNEVIKQMYLQLKAYLLNIKEGGSNEIIDTISDNPNILTLHEYLLYLLLIGQQDEDDVSAE